MSTRTLIEPIEFKTTVYTCDHCHKDTLIGVKTIPCHICATEICPACRRTVMLPWIDYYRSSRFIDCCPPCYDVAPPFTKQLNELGKMFNEAAGLIFLQWGTKGKE